MAMSWHEVPRSLQIKYLHAAALTVAQLARLAGELQRHAAGIDALKLMLRRFHGLTAWAGQHGLAAVAVTAQQGEHDCATLAGAGMLPEPGHLAQIAGLIQALRHEVYRQRATGAVAEEVLWAVGGDSRTTGAVAEEVLWAPGGRS
jgi:hypothetical protein